MPPEQKRAKTESLSLRLDPKTKFILDFVARINGQSITTVVERAIKSASESQTIGPAWAENEQKNWANFWDASEGVRTLRLIADPNYPTNFEEDELRSFTLAHWPYFYMDDSGKIPRRAYVDILWPNINRYLDIWRTEKGQDYWAASTEMSKNITAAKVVAPIWPPPNKAPPKSEPDDDEIPF